MLKVPWWRGWFLTSFATLFSGHSQVFWFDCSILDNWILSYFSWQLILVLVLAAHSDRDWYSWIWQPTWRPPITRSNINGIIAKKSTKFIGCLKNLHFLGEQINLTRYSIRKNKTIAFSEIGNVGVNM